MGKLEEQRELGKQREMGKLGKLTQNSTLPVPCSLFCE